MNRLDWRYHANSARTHPCNIGKVWHCLTYTEDIRSDSTQRKLRSYSLLNVAQENELCRRIFRLAERAFDSKNFKKCVHIRREECFKTSIIHTYHGRKKEMDARYSFRYVEMCGVWKLCSWRMYGPYKRR